MVAFIPFTIAILLATIATTRDNDTVAALAFDKRADSQRLGKGGGIAITLKGSSAFNMFEISNCNFTGNSATTGGGLDISLQDFAKSNTLLSTKLYI